MADSRYLEWLAFYGDLFKRGGIGFELNLVDFKKLAADMERFEKTGDSVLMKQIFFYDLCKFGAVRLDLSRANHAEFLTAIVKRAASLEGKEDAGSSWLESLNTKNKYNYYSLLALHLYRHAVLPEEGRASSPYQEGYSRHNHQLGEFQISEGSFIEFRHESVKRQGIVITVCLKNLIVYAGGSEVFFLPMECVDGIG